MLMELRTLGLDYLKQELDPDKAIDSELWYQNLRKTNRAALFPYLVESAGKVSQAFVLDDVGNGIVKMAPYDVVKDTLSGGCLESAFPFIKPSGSQSAAIGPVIKRTWSKENGAGPSEKITKTTIKTFEEIAQSEAPWASYFGDVVNILKRPRLQLPNGTIIEWQSRYENLLIAAMHEIGPQSQTVFVAVRNSKGLLPGEDERYTQYLFEAVLAGNRYTTKDTPARPHSVCSLCGAQNIVAYSNGVKGAGINLLNADRLGAFSEINVENSWKRYAVCGDCADLLFIAKSHVLKKGPNNQQPFGARVAGSTALVIPTFLPMMSSEMRQELWSHIMAYIESVTSNVNYIEGQIFHSLKDVQGIISFTIVWADIGQNIEKVSGSISHVLPSRLRDLSIINDRVVNDTHGLYPQPLKNGNFLSYDLNLRILQWLFYRPGPHSKSLNQSAKLQKFKRSVAESVYHRTALLTSRWEDEFLVTARAYFDYALIESEGYKSFLYEWDGKESWQMSGARWIKRINQFRAYLQQPEVGVIRMSTEYFEPTLPSLKPFFGPESGIDTREKAYAFILGILYGKVLQIQGARGVNVSANALTWLKRLTLRGDDLPELYVKIREKLLAYDAEGIAEIRNVLEAFGQLAISLGDKIALNDVQTTYYLLLGQSVTNQVLPSKTKDKGDNANG